MEGGNREGRPAQEVLAGPESRAEAASHPSSHAVSLSSCSLLLLLKLPAVTPCFQV